MARAGRVIHRRNATVVLCARAQRSSARACAFAQRRDDFRATLIGQSQLIESNSVAMLSSSSLFPRTRVVKIPFRRDFKYPRAEIALMRNDETAARSGRAFNLIK